MLCMTHILSSDCCTIMMAVMHVMPVRCDDETISEVTEEEVTSTEG